MAGNVTDEAAALEWLSHWNDAEGNVVTVAWTLLCAFLVVSMQLGFAMVEVGSVRNAHRMTVLAKNIMDSTVSCLAFWAYLQLTRGTDEESFAGMARPRALFQWALCATSVTVCSGAMAERTHMFAYLSYAAVMAGVIYPVLADSVWGTSGLLHREFHGRWNAEYRYHDFAGSGVVHFAGGMAALVGNLLLGRRIVRPPLEGDLEDIVGRASSPNSADIARPKEGWPRRFDSKIRDESEFGAFNFLNVLGMFTLWIGWYGFNAGSTFCMNRICATTAGIIAWNTTLSACAGGIGAYCFCYAVNKNLDTSVICNGVLGGLVAITAGCDVAGEEQAALIGLIAGLVVYPASRCLVQKLKLDDPPDAIPVHAFCGLWGTIAVAFCRPDCRMLESLSAASADEARFCQDGFAMGPQLAAQLWGLFTALWWVTPLSGAIWLAFALCEISRSLEEEHFELADRALSELAPTAQHEAELVRVSILLRQSAKRSPLLRAALARHGWTHVGFAAKLDVPLLRDELHCIRCERLESGLEVGRSGPLRTLAQLLHCCRPVRECFYFRLRISPFAELSGLGTVDFSGGQLVGLIARIAEAQRHSAASPIRNEVRELNRMVHDNQDLLVRALSRHRGRSSDRAYLSRRSPGLTSVPEHLVPQETTAAAARPRSQGQYAEVVSDCGTQASSQEGSTPSVMSVQRMQRPAPVTTSGLSRSETSSNRTASNHGTMSPRSWQEETPPPSVIGSRSAATGAGSTAPWQVQDVASQLMSMMQAQQGLLNVLAQTPNTSNRSGSSTPESNAVAQDQLLATALHRIMYQQSEARSTTSYSTGSTSPRRSG